MTTKTCETCEHFVDDKHNFDYGNCHRNPPISNDSHGGWVRVHKRKDWCGEHTAKAPTKDDFRNREGSTVYDMGALPASCPYCGDPLELVRPGKHQPVGCCERAVLLDGVARDMLEDLIDLVDLFEQGVGGYLSQDRLDRYRNRMAEATAERGRK
jgi:hypothetical protein